MEICLRTLRQDISLDDPKYQFNQLQLIRKALYHHDDDEEQENQTSEIPFQMKMKQEELKKTQKIYLIMDIDLSIKNIARALNIDESLLNQLDAEIYFINPAKQILSLQKKILTEADKSMKGLSTVINRQIFLYKRDQKKFLDEKINQLINLIGDFENLKSQGAKIQVLKGSILQLVKSHQKGSTKIQDQLSDFQRNMSDVSESIEQIRISLNTFQNIVNGTYSKTIDEFQKIANEKVANKKAINKTKEEIEKTNLQIKQSEDNLAKLGTNFNKLEEDIEKNQKISINYQGQLNLQNFISEILKERKSQIQYLHQAITKIHAERINENLQIQSLQKEKENRLFQFEMKIIESQIQISDLESEMNEKTTELENCNFIQKLFSKNRREISILNTKLVNLKNNQANTREQFDQLHMHIKKFQEERNKQFDVNIERFQSEIIKLEDQIKIIQTGQIGVAEEKSKNEVEQKKAQLSVENQNQQVEKIKQQLKENLEGCLKSKNELEAKKSDQLELQKNLKSAQKKLDDQAQISTQLDRLKLPTEFISSFKNLSEQMKEFNTLIQEKMQNVDNCLIHFNEELELFNSHSEELEATNLDSHSQVSEQLQKCLVGVLKEINELSNLYEESDSILNEIHKRRMSLAEAERVDSFINH